jgi:uncharacterized membrane protein YhaH (DUF805 family)
MGNSYTSNEFLFSFRGRINRAKYWYAVFASSVFCGVLLEVLALALGRVFGTSIKSLELNFLDIVPFSFAFSDTGSASTKTLVSLLFYAGATPIVMFGTWFLAATTVKRLHDRNKSGWWMVPLLIAPDVFNRLEARLPDSHAAAALGLVALVLCVWGFIELLCLRGTRGPNRFGPDPLAPRDTRPRWDQQSELEFVPHSTGPSPGPYVMRAHE